MGCKHSKVTPLQTPTPPPDFRRVSERRSGRFSRVHEPRYQARVTEDLSVLDLEEFGDSFSDLAIEEYLNRGDEARRASGQQNHRHPVPRHTRPTPIPGAYLCSPDSSPENSPASSPWGSPSSSTPHPNMPGVGWFPRQEGSEMTRLPADITSVLAPRPSRATTTADEEDEPSITELCIQNRNIMQARIQLGIAAPITPYVPDPLIQAVAQAANYNAAPVRFAAPRTGGTTAGRGQRYVNTSGSGTNTRAPTRRQIRWAELPDIAD